MAAPGSARAERRVLDPPTRLGEILFGLIMFLTFTGTFHVAAAGNEEVRTMLIAALGCNVAWGFVDGTMFVMNALIERSRAHDDLRRLQAARTPAEADAALEEALPERFGEVLRPGDLVAVRERLRTIPPPPERATVTRRDLLGGLGVFLLVTGITVPAAAPFLFVPDVGTALRVSHFLVLGMMFTSGWGVARYAGLPPVRTGLLVSGIGVVLMGVTILLGG